MRYGRAFGIIAVAACGATHALGQVRGGAVDSDDAFRLREAIDAQEQKQRILQKRDHVIGATEQQPSSVGPVQREEAGVGGRMMIIQDKLLKLREDRALAVTAGRPVEAIDAEIARLQEELSVHQSAPFPVAPRP